MTERIIEVGDSIRTLRVQNQVLILESDDGHENVRVPIRDLGVVVASGKRLRFTHAMLSELALASVPLVLCDRRSMPAAMLLPLDTHSTQAERFAKQAQASVPTKKRVWKALVQAKIRAQAKLLETLYGSDAGLRALAQRVRSGDPNNIEAQAAQRYWPRLFGDTTFRRRADRDDQNRFLNYGYAVLRAAVARSICAAGLHPSLGVHHHNKYDAFCLADDVLEPYRPLVDKVVVRIVAETGASCEFDRSIKKALLSILTVRYDCKGEKRQLFDVIGSTVGSLVHVIENKAKNMVVVEV